MTVEYIRYDLAAHQPEELVRAYTIAADALLAAPECVAFEPLIGEVAQMRRFLLTSVVWCRQ